MKKLLILFLIIIGFSSCEDRTYYLKYVVFYPNENDTIEVSNTEGYYYSSDRGSNYIKEGSITGPDIYHGSSPYKILYYEYEENKPINNSLTIP